MNPFDLRGPEFLVFYFILSTIVIGVLILSRRAAEFGDAPKTDVSDPYLIAYLRGGKKETFRLATLSLIERELLCVQDQAVQASVNSCSHYITNPVEEKLLRIFAKAGPASSMFDSPTLASACSDYEKRLAQDSLLPDEETKATRRQR